jgi:hypothetical protein
MLDAPRRAADTGREMSQERRQFHIWEIAGGLAIRFRTYAARRAALEAAGLRE